MTSRESKKRLYTRITYGNTSFKHLYKGIYYKEVTRNLQGAKLSDLGLNLNMAQRTEGKTNFIRQQQDNDIMHYVRKFTHQ